MTELLAVAIGGAIGAVLRYLSGIILIRIMSRSDVINGTVFSNLLGCFLAGMALAWIANTAILSPEITLFLTVGILGSLTTFSTFALETYQLIGKETKPQLAAYLSLQLIAAFLLTAAGYWLIHTFGGL
ncbi:MAG: fluoride efflux transporter CrcB [Balneolaceae bacterium]|nr:MAG: fluoride efflux transporter CrcB [Balneolaceae bacterium]